MSAISRQTWKTHIEAGHMKGVSSLYVRNGLRRQNVNSKTALMLQFSKNTKITAALESGMQTAGVKGKPRRKEGHSREENSRGDTRSREDTTRGKRRLRQYIHKVKNSGDNRWEQTRNNKESQRTSQNKKGTYSH